MKGVLAPSATVLISNLLRQWILIKWFYPISLSLGFMVGYVLLFGWPQWWPAEARQWFFYILVVGGLWDWKKNHVPASVAPPPDSRNRKSPGSASETWSHLIVLFSDFLLKFVFCSSIAWWVFQPIFQHTYSSVPQMGAALCLMAFLGLLVWCYNEKVATSFPAPVFLLTHCLLTSSLSLLLALSGSLSTSQMAGVLASCVGVLFLLNFLQKSQKSLPQMTATLSLLEVFLCLYAYHYVEVAWWSLTWLFLSLLTPYGFYFLFSSRKRPHMVFQLLFVGLVSLLFVIPPIVWGAWGWGLF